MKIAGRLAHAALCFAFVPLIASCSFIFVEGVPDEQAQRRGALRCTAGRLAPVVDGALAGVFFVAAAMTVAGGDELDDTTTLGTTTAAWLAASGVSGASLVYGLNETSDCRRSAREAPP